MEETRETYHCIVSVVSCWEIEIGAVFGAKRKEKDKKNSSKKLQGIPKKTLKNYRLDSEEGQVERQYEPPVSHRDSGCVRRRMRHSPPAPRTRTKDAREIPNCRSFRQSAWPARCPCRTICTWLPGWISHYKDNFSFYKNALGPIFFWRINVFFGVCRWNFTHTGASGTPRFWDIVVQWYSSNTSAIQLRLQSTSHILPTNDKPAINQSITQSINQWTNQSLTASNNQSTNQSLTPSINQLIKRPINQSINRWCTRDLFTETVKVTESYPRDAGVCQGFQDICVRS